jgi:hypothetical protein
MQGLEVKVLLRPQSFYPKSVHQMFTKRSELVGLGGNGSDVGDRGERVGCPDSLEEYAV